MPKSILVRHKTIDTPYIKCLLSYVQTYARIKLISVFFVHCQFSASVISRSFDTFGAVFIYFHGFVCEFRDWKKRSIRACHSCTELVSEVRAKNRGYWVHVGTFAFQQFMEFYLFENIEYFMVDQPCFQVFWEVLGLSWLV